MPRRWTVPNCPTKSAKLHSPTQPWQGPNLPTQGLAMEHLLELRWTKWGPFLAGKQTPFFMPYPHVHLLEGTAASWTALRCVDSSVLQRLTKSFGVEWRVQNTKVLLIHLCPSGAWSIRTAQSAAITDSTDRAWQAKWHFHLPSPLLPPTRKTPNHSPILQLE